MPRRTPKSNRLLQMAEKGPIRARDLDRAGIPRSYLRRLCERGQLERVDRGLYRLAGAATSELSSLAEVAIRVPQGVICLLSALELHQLGSQLPHAVWVMIGRRAQPPRISNPRIEVVRASGQALEHGVETRIVEGVSVQVTSAAKTVADCHRYVRHVGLDVALEVTRDYLRRHRGGIDALVEAARADRVYNRMRPYLEALT